MTLREGLLSLSSVAMPSGKHFIHFLSAAQCQQVGSDSQLPRVCESREYQEKGVTEVR